MDAVATEAELVRKLIVKQHLNVPERRLLPGGRAKASLLLDTIEEILHQTGRLPIDWHEDAEFYGGLLVRQDDGTSRIDWKAEVGFMRYELCAVERFDSAREAAETWLRKMFGDDIDSVPIDWDH